jgi:hypothetical protein
MEADGSFETSVRATGRQIEEDHTLSIYTEIKHVHEFAYLRKTCTKLILVEGTVKLSPGLLGYHVMKTCEGGYSYTHF